MGIRRVMMVVCVAWAVVACSDGGGGSGGVGQGDGGGEDVPDVTSGEDIGEEDGGEEDGLSLTEPQEGVSADGVDASVDAAAGEVRVGRVGAAGEDFEGIWSHCRAGDFKLYNEVIAVCIQAETTNRMEMFTGGKLVDARRVDGPAEDVLDGIFPLAGFGTMQAESVRVVRDGTQGGAAVLRVEGRDIPMAYVVGVIPGLFDEAQGLKMTTEYRLEPDSDVVEIVTWYENGTDGRRIFGIGDWFGWGDRARLWTPGGGFGDLANRYSWMAGVGQGHSFAWVVEERATDLGLQAQGLPFVASRARSGSLLSGESTVFRRWFVVGDGTLESVRERAAELSGAELEGAPRQVVLRTESGAAVPQKWVVVFAGDDALTAARTDVDGRATLTLPEGLLRFEVESWDGSGVVDVEREVGSGVVELSLPTPGAVAIKLRDADGAPVHGYVELRGEGVWRGVALNGREELRVAPGVWQVVARRGPEWNGAQREIEVVAGESVEVELVLEHVVDTAGWISADFHQHMEPSPDSEAHIEGRVLENVGLGVEFAVPTDHDVVSDLRPFIDDLGLGDDLGTLSGVEISPVETHVGLYPMPYRPDERGRGTLPLAVLEDGEVRRRLIPEVVEEARRLDASTIVQLNHGRRDSSGMLELVNYDPLVGPGAITDQRFFSGFDTMEIINRFQNTCRLFADWASFMNAGLTPTGLANSDEHNLTGSTGVPRNYLKIDKDPGEVTAADVRDALQKGRVTAGANGFIDIVEATPGDTIEALGGSVELTVRVQTPAWAAATSLVAVVNGEQVAAQSRAAAPELIDDFNVKHSISADEDAWVVFFATGPPPQGPVSSGVPTVLFTNPVFIDVDGDADADGSAWEAPGIGPIAAPGVDAFCR